MLTPRESLITLNLIPGLGSIRIQSLLEHFGSAELVLEAPAALLSQVSNIGPRMAAAIADWQNCTHVHAELECARQHGVRIVTLQDDDYPRILRRMSDPPIVLYVRGEWNQEDANRSVAIVGTRHATTYGHLTARKFGRELADAGCTIISGLARGIDTAGHRGALDAGGRTLAIIGSGLGAIYPPENRELADEICRGHGAVISEFPMMTPPGRTTFPQRNRVVAAWSRAVLVAQAPQRSGAIHTAGLAAEQYGNSIFAIPGDVTMPESAGCHALIRDGAILCTSPQELLQDMNWDGAPRQLNLFDTPAPAPDAPLPEDPESAELLDTLRRGVDTLDALCSALGKGAHELNPILMRLQIQQRILPQPGGRYEARP